jgi:hypothetical protein
VFGDCKKILDVIWKTVLIESVILSGEAIGLKVIFFLFLPSDFRLEAHYGFFFYPLSMSSSPEYGSRIFVQGEALAQRSLAVNPIYVPV